MMSHKSVEKEHLTLEARVKVLNALNGGKSERAICEEFGIGKVL